jgi:hypothetical protein
MGVAAAQKRDDGAHTLKAAKIVVTLFGNGLLLR